MLKDFKIHQIAIFFYFGDDIKNNFREMFGRELIVDKQRISGFLNDQEKNNSPVNLYFDFELMNDVEIEFIKTWPGHWHWNDCDKKYPLPFLSHLGTYLSDDKFDNYFIELSKKFKILQFTKSHDHSNKRHGDGEKSSRSYIDAIFDTKDFIGFNLKLSKRNKLENIK